MRNAHSLRENRFIAFARGNMPPTQPSEGTVPPGGPSSNPQQGADQRWQNIARTLDPKNASVRIVERMLGMEASIKTIQGIQREMGQITLDINRIDIDQTLPPEEKQAQLTSLSAKLQNAQGRLDTACAELGTAWLINLEGASINLPEGGTALLKNFSKVGDAIKCDASYEAPNGTQTRSISFSRIAAMGIGRSMTDNLQMPTSTDAERAPAWVPLFRSPEDVGLPRMVYDQLLGR